MSSPSRRLRKRLLLKLLLLLPRSTSRLSPSSGLLVLIGRLLLQGLLLMLQVLLLILQGVRRRRRGVTAPKRDSEAEEHVPLRQHLVVPVPSDRPRQLVAGAGPGDVEAEDCGVAAEGADLSFLFFVEVFEGRKREKEGQSER